MSSDEHEGWDDTTPPDPPNTTRTPTSKAPTVRATVYGSVDDFVTAHLAVLIQRRLQGPVTWCPQWWSHPEAVDRLTAMWKAWEHFHDTPADGLSDWWILHADPHLAVLLDADRGPFVWCSPDKGHAERYEPLPVIARPNQRSGATGIDQVR